MTATPHLAAAIENAQVEPDSRGLMPLREARELLAGTTAFHRDNGDAVWAAMLSLEDGAELAEATKEIAWRFHPRGRDNTALVERYGDGALPWLRDQIRDGVLVDLPWCIGPSLLGLESTEVFELLWELRGYNDTAGMQQWELVEPEVLDDEDLARGAELLLAKWCARHPRIALGELASRARSSDRAAGLLRRQAMIAPGPTIATLTELLGDKAEALADELGLARSLTAEAILDHLDRAAAGIWPVFNYASDGRVEYFGLRLIACRSRVGDGWGVLLERITGSYPDALRVERFGYGSELSLQEPFLDAPYPELGFEGDDPLFHGGTADGPGGSLSLDEGLIDEHDLRPGICCEPGYWPYRVLLIRAYLAVHPHSFWLDPNEAPGLLGLDDADVLVVSDSFHHVIGPYGRQGVPEQPWEIAPSESETYQTLARAIADRDPGAFVPGESNLDWRLHAFVEQPITLPWTTWRFPPGEGDRDHLESALLEAAVAGRDDRGLMPIERARTIVAASTQFAKGRGERIDGQFVQPTDTLWAALLSLADGAELAREATRLDWELDPRGSPDNLAPAQRYGDALVDWLRAAVDHDSVLINRPSCLRANVLATACPAVVDLLASLAGFEDPTEPGTTTAQLDALWEDWLVAHSTVGYRRLSELALEGHQTARDRLRRCALVDHDTVWAALGARAADVYAEIGAPTELTPEHVLAHLDRAAASPAVDADAWPRFFCDAYPAVAEYHGLRIIGARAPGSWGVVIERLTGYGHQAKIARYFYGPAVRGHLEEHDEAIELTFDGDFVTGPAGAFDLASADIPKSAARLTERPDYWGAIEAPSWNRAFRSYLAAHPDAYWRDPTSLIAPLDLGSDASVVIVATGFSHACGPEVPPESEAQPWHILPSASVAYQTLAKALVSGATFAELGDSNTGWSTHAVFEPS